jgi:hypothetical protein
MKEPRHFGLSPGDLGVITIAIVFALGTLYLFIGPSPFAPLFAPHPKPVPREVTIDLKTWKAPGTP